MFLSWVCLIPAGANSEAKKEGCVAHMWPEYLGFGDGGREGEIGYAYAHASVPEYVSPV